MRKSDPKVRESLTSVLVPTDFSKGAQRAIARALLLPLAAGGTIHVVHVVPKDLPAAAKRDATRTLQQVVERAREDRNDRSVEVTSAVLAGEPYIEIIHCARKLGVDVVVLGMSGSGRLRKAILGTTAERVIRKGDVPVLAVNDKAVHRYHCPLIATDLEDASHRTFEVALRVFGRSARSVRVVHAFWAPFEGYLAPTAAAREGSEYRKAFKKKAVDGLGALLDNFQDAGVRWSPVVLHGDPRVVVISECLRSRADVIAVGTHGRSGVAHALVGSVAAWIIENAPCDVLVARPIRFSFELP